MLAAEVVFHVHPHEHLHGTVERAGNLRVNGHDVAQLDGLLEGDVVDRSGDTYAAAAAVGADGGRNVHPIQQVASHQVPQRIGVVGHDDACAGSVRVSGGALFDHG